MTGKNACLTALASPTILPLKPASVDHLATPLSPSLDALRTLIASAMLADRYRFASRLRGIERALARGADVAEGIRKLTADAERSAAILRDRAANRPKPAYPGDLPVVERLEDIAKAIAENQVLVLSGETGSGKTTQLPKICLEMGRGVAG